MNTRRRLANLANSQASTGPRTRAGKERVRKNAVKHGLSSRLALDPAIADQTEELARFISGDMSIPLTYARAIAEVCVSVARVRRAKADRINLYNATRFARRKGSLYDTELIAELARLQRYEDRALNKQKKLIRNYVCESAVSALNSTTA